MLAGCNTVTIPDSEVCTWLPSNRGFCSTLISHKDRVIEQPEWLIMQVGRFSMTAEDFADMQVFIEQSCQHVKCTKEMEKLRARILENVENIVAEHSKHF